MSTHVAPHSAGLGGPAFSFPKGACDCHMHLFDNRYPFASGSVLSHGDASVADYRMLQQRLGMERCVIVQPSSYGRQHQVLLGGLQALGPSARGVAVVDPQVTEQALAGLTAQGVVGARFNLVQRGATDETMLQAVTQRVKPYGWHLQLHLLPEDFLRLADSLCALEVDVVLDHFARIRTVPEWADQVEAKVRQLLGTGRGWIKFSGAYIASLDAPHFHDLDHHAQCLLSDCPDRIVWGSDWPHVTESIKPDDAQLANLLIRWMPDERLRHQVLVTNPEKLYGFGPSPCAGLVTRA